MLLPVLLSDTLPELPLRPQLPFVLPLLPLVLLYFPYPSCPVPAAGPFLIAFSTSLSAVFDRPRKKPGLEGFPGLALVGLRSLLLSLLSDRFLAVGDAVAGDAAAVAELYGNPIVGEAINSAGVPVGPPTLGRLAPADGGKDGDGRGGVAEVFRCCCNDMPTVPVDLLRVLASEPGPAVRLLWMTGIVTPSPAA